MPKTKQLIVSCENRPSTLAHVALGTRSKEGTVSAPAIQPLCYEHHVPMTPPQMIVVSPEFLTYACPQPECPVRYQASKGYFLVAREKHDRGGPDAQEGRSALPRVLCPIDWHPMYLRETQREHLSYRLWGCPQCGASKVGGDLPVNSL